MHFTDCAIPRLILILKYALKKKDVEDWVDATVDRREKIGRFSCSEKQDISLVIYSRTIVYAFN